MKIAILAPRKEFKKEQLAKLKAQGDIVFVKERKEYPLAYLKKLVRGSDILAVDPDILGGFEAAWPRLREIIDSTPSIKGLALATTSTEYIDLEYCAEKEIRVANVPGYATEAVAEHTIGMIIGALKRIFLSDRREQKGNFRLEMGYELVGKTLGVIGLGRIGTRVAKLARCLGMRVFGYNRTPKKIPGIKLVPLETLYRQSDVISLHLAAIDETKGFIDRSALLKMKKGVFIINLASRWVVDEKAMAYALKTGRVDSYVYEGDDLNSGPLAGIERALGFRQFGWYTKEALERAIQIWVEQIQNISHHLATKRH